MIGVKAALKFSKYNGCSTLPKHMRGVRAALKFSGCHGCSTLPKHMRGFRAALKFSGYHSCSTLHEVLYANEYKINSRVFQAIEIFL